jgi:hypothetical protein
MAESAVWYVVGAPEPAGPIEDIVEFLKRQQKAALAERVQLTLRELAVSQGGATSGD